MPNYPDFLSFIDAYARRLARSGNARTSETYLSAGRSFKEFLCGARPTFSQITGRLMESYELWLHGRNLTRNTSSFYMRILRAAYNRGVERGYTRQRDPFRHVYTGVDRTRKRAVTLPVIKKIKMMDLNEKPGLELSRDLFLFSFYTRGMSFIDMAYLRISDLDGEVLRYRRKKTGQSISIRWEPCMQEIVDRHPGSGGWLLPILSPTGGNLRRQYQAAIVRENHHLGIISKQLGLPVELTTYVARHSWASLAYSQDIPVSVISEAMGHTSEKTTRIYLSSIGNSKIDKANRQILKLL